MFDAVQFKASREEEGQYRWCSSPRGNLIKGEMKFYKVSKGDLLYGKEQVTLEDSMMTCACSLKRWELEQTKIMSEGKIIDGRKDISLHCTEDGSYETLQCDNGKCWCVEQKRGRLTISKAKKAGICIIKQSQDLFLHFRETYFYCCS